MKIRNILAILGITFTSSFNEWVTTELIANATPTGEPIGRILSVENSQRLQAGQLLHLGESLELTNTEKLVVLCYATGKAQTVSGQIGDICPPANQHCRLRNDTCYNRRPRSPLDEFHWVTPYSTRLLNNRPSFSWSEVPGATHYLVRVVDTTTLWERKVTNTSLAYPMDAPPLTPGRFYEVILTPYRDNVSLLESQDTIVQLQVEIEAEAERIETLVAQVMDLNLPLEDVAQDLDSIYVSRELFTTTIETLEGIVTQGTQSALVHEILGDRYLQLGLIEQAEFYYQKARELEQMASHLSE